MYVLKGTKYYVWCTNDLTRRINEHKRGNNYFTRRIGKDIVLVGWFEIKNKIDAMRLEKNIKASWHIERRIKDPTFIMGA